jgi:hypothetical protein
MRTHEMTFETGEQHLVCGCISKNSCSWLTPHPWKWRGFCKQKPFFLREGLFVHLQALWGGQRTFRGKWVCWLLKYWRNLSNWMGHKRHLCSQPHINWIFLWVGVSWHPNQMMSVFFGNRKWSFLQFCGVMRLLITPHSCFALNWRESACI